MRRSFSRTSVSIDEAVAILLKLADGPITVENIPEGATDDEVAECLDYEFDLDKYLREEHEVLIGNLAMAKHEGESEATLAEMQGKIDEHEKLIANAKSYLCTVMDEINKGTDSRLRVDSRQSHAGCTFITLTSLQEWASGYDKKSLDPVPERNDGSVDESLKNAEFVKGPERVRQRHQEAAILEKIKELGYPPQALPDREPGKGGAKSAVREALSKSQLFSANTSFDKAWERLRSDGAIRGG